MIKTINFINFDNNSYLILLHTLYRQIVNILVVFSLIFLSSCQTQMMTESRLPKQNIAIGSYGGFTGMNEKVVFLKNGMVYKYESMPEGVTKISFVKKLKRKEARQIFKIASGINFSNLKNDAPANMNYYLERNRWLKKDESYRWSQDLDTTNTNHNLILKLLKLI